MTPILRIDDEVLHLEDLVKALKLSGQFGGLMEDYVRERLTVAAARKQGIRLSEADIQDRADQFRRVNGLHRAADTNHYLDALGVSLEEFEAFITDSLYQERMLEQVESPAAVEQYFRLNSPKFEAVEVSHVLVDTEGQARELLSMLEEEPETFADLAREHSLADTREQGGRLGRVMRGVLAGDVEGRVFNAAAGELLGPFAAPDGGGFEIFRVDGRHPPALDEDTAAEVRRRLREAWLQARAQEHVIEVR